MKDPYVPLPRVPRHTFDGYGQPSDPAAVFLYEDFSGTALGAEWDTVSTSGEEEVGIEDDGEFKISIGETAITQPENGVLDQGDIRTIDLNQNVIMEMRVKIPVGPTASEVIWGLASNHAQNKDIAILVSAWFRLQANLNLVLETDDTTNNEDDEVTDITLVEDEWHLYRIDFRDLSSVKFFIDGQRLAPDFVFNMTNLTADEAVLQPYFSCSKGSNNSTAEIRIDYIKIWHDRGP